MMQKHKEKDRMAYTGHIQQFYKITPDESVIDKRLADVVWTEENWRDEESQRLHRIYKVIMEHEKLLHDVLVFVMLCQHDYISGGETYLQEHYHAEVTLIDILLKQKALFHASDRQWLEDLKGRMDRRDEDDGEPSLDIEPLRDAFTIEPDGFYLELGEITDDRKA